MADRHEKIVTSYQFKGRRRWYIFFQICLHYYLYNFTLKSTFDENEWGFISSNRSTFSRGTDVVQHTRFTGIM